MKDFVAAEEAILQRAERMAGGPNGIKASAVEIRAMAGNAMPGDASAAFHGIEKGMISIEQYVSIWVGILEEFEKQRFVAALERNLIQLGAP